MSNIYNLEPHAYGQILLRTTFGDVELELFTKQCPKNARNFVQLCLDGYYDGTLFDRVEKDFIAIGGELDLPGSESLKIETVPDEFHSRLKFSRRGLIATANTEKDSNGPKFFFTLGPAPELQNKHTIFGRVRGDSVYHLVDLNDCNVDEDMLPISEKRIIQVIVKENPYPELKARSEFKDLLLKLRRSDRDTNVEDEDFEDASSGEYLEPKYDFKNAKKLSFYEDSDDDGDEADSKPIESALSVDEKSASIKHEQSVNQDTSNGTQSAASDSRGEAGSDAVATAREKKLREIREQIRSLKQKLESESANRIRNTYAKDQASLDLPGSSTETKDSRTLPSKQTAIEDPDLSSSSRESKLTARKGHQRERETIELVQHFKKRLKGAPKWPESTGSDRPSLKKEQEADRKQYLDEDEDIELALNLVDGDDWLHHKFDAKDDPSSSMAKDANTKGDDWYSIDDPRNPIAQRVELERARDYKRHRERDRNHRNEMDSHEHRSRHHRHRHHHHH